MDLALGEDPQKVLEDVNRRLASTNGVDGSGTDVHPLSIGPNVVVSGKRRNKLRRSLELQLGYLQRCSLVAQKKFEDTLSSREDVECVLKIV